MLYGGPPRKPAPPAKVCTDPYVGLNGPGPYSYGLLAKQPGSNYKIQLRDIERMRNERLRMENEENFKSITRHGQLQKMISSADKKFLYNQIKSLVEREMEANRHLFVEECPKRELKIEEEVQSEVPKVSQEEMMKEIEEFEKKKEEEIRKKVEEKRLQLFIESSEDLRSAAVAKRKKEISNINYNIIQEKEKSNKEQEKKKRESSIIECFEFHKNQAREKEEERRKLLEKKQQFRNELYVQVQEKEVVRKQQAELKIVECNYFKEINEQLNEEEKLEKLEHKKKQIQKKEEIEQFTKEREKLLSYSNDASKMMKPFALLMQQSKNDDEAGVLEAKRQVRLENEMFMKHYETIKEERRRQSEEMSNAVMKQIEEIEQLKVAIERERVEARRKRTEECNKALQAQLEARQLSLEQQKEMKRESVEEAIKKHENYLEEERRLCEKRQQYKCQIRNDLNEQIKKRNEIFEQQREIDMKDHEKNMREIAEREKLLKKLLSEI